LLVALQSCVKIPATVEVQGVHPAKLATATVLWLQVVGAVDSISHSLRLLTSRMQVLALLFCLVVASSAAFTLYPPSVTAFVANLAITITPTGQAPLALTGTEKYLVGATVTNDVIFESATVQGQTVSATEWLTLDANNLNEWDIESTAATTCNHNTVPVANLAGCTAWTSAVAGIFTQDCKATNNGQTEIDHYVVAAQGNVITKMNVTITVDGQLVQTNSVVYTVTGVLPTAKYFVLPTTCAPALQRFRPKMY